MNADVCTPAHESDVGHISALLVALVAGHVHNCQAQTLTGKMEQAYLHNMPRQLAVRVIAFATMPGWWFAALKDSHQGKHEQDAWG